MLEEWTKKKNTTFDAVKKKLKENGFAVSVFDTKEAASAYLNHAIDQTTVGMGGSMTLADMGLPESLAAHNVVYSHGFTPCDPKRAQHMAARAEVYILSANAIAEDTGEILNIDGTGNRTASSLYGHRKVYFVAGKNKLSPDFDSALWRLRNVVAPKNAQRLHRKTPCAVKADKCYNCDSPERICRGLVVLYKKMTSMDMEVVLIDEELGY